MRLRSSAAWLALVLGACESGSRRAFLVERADVETILAVEACPEVEQVLGAERARALLAGHLVRAGGKLVVVVREWEPGLAEPVRRLTLAIGADLLGETALPDPRITLRADRVTADGSRVRALEVDRGWIRIREVPAARWSISLDLRFRDAAEPPLTLRGELPVRTLDQLDPAGGRASPVARPEEFLRP